MSVVLALALSDAHRKELELLTLQTEYKLNWTLKHTMSTDGTINWLKSFINMYDMNRKKNMLGLLEEVAPESIRSISSLFSSSPPIDGVECV